MSVEFVIKNAALINTTPPATSRADDSFAGFGNGKRFVMRQSLALNPTNLVRYYLGLPRPACLTLVSLNKAFGASMTIPYGRQEITAADIKAVVEVLQSDYLTQGPMVPVFVARQ